MGVQRTSVTFLFLLFVSGCAAAYVDITKTAKGFHTATNASEVEILKIPPSRPFVELGTITAAYFELDHTAKMHNALRTEAAALGANAVILTEEGIWKDTRWATGVAVRY